MGSSMNRQSDFTTNSNVSFNSNIICEDEMQSQLVELSDSSLVSIASTNGNISNKSPAISNQTYAKNVVSSDRSKNRFFKATFDSEPNIANIKSSMQQQPKDYSFQLSSSEDEQMKPKPKPKAKSRKGKGKKR